jgi:hypothetical protein
VILLAGTLISSFFRATRTRFAASLTSPESFPTISNIGSPLDTSISTLTGLHSTPKSPPDKISVTILPPFPHGTQKEGSALLQKCLDTMPIRKTGEQMKHLLESCLNAK